MLAIVTAEKREPGTPVPGFRLQQAAYWQLKFAAFSRSPLPL
jgi:hypothetical protein